MPTYLYLRYNTIEILKEMKINVKTALALGGIAFSLVGCNKEKTVQSHEVIETTMPNPLKGYDPAKVTDLYTHRVYDQVFEGLIKLGEDNTPQPSLAEKYERSEDGRTYTFYIKKNVKFHNGDLLTADDFKWSFDRTCNEKLVSPNAQAFMGDIVGADEVIAGKAESISGVKVLDKHRLQITLKRPVVYFLAKLAYSTGYVYPKGKVSITEIKDIKQLIGTGPYKMSTYHQDQLVILDANKDYWGGAPKCPQIRYSIVKDSMVGLNEYKSGKYQFEMVPAVEVPALRKDPKFNKQMQFKDHAGAYYLELNPGVYKPFANLKVRQAFAMAIDQKMVLDRILNGVGVAAYGIIPPGVPGHREKTNHLPFDPIKAKKLLAEAGYSNPASMPKLDLVVPANSPSGIPVTENVVLQLQKNLGIPIKVKRIDFNASLDKINKKEIAFRFAGWAADYIDPANFTTDLYKSGSGINRCNYSNKKFDELVTKADSMTNHEERMKLYQQAEDILLQDAGFIPLFFPTEVWLIRENLEGLKFNLGGPMTLNTVYAK
jgi:oligopeptide transport system substrate-binding protein